MPWGNFWLVFCYNLKVLILVLVTLPPVLGRPRSHPCCSGCSHRPSPTPTSWSRSWRFLALHFPPASFRNAKDIDDSITLKPMKSSFLGSKQWLLTIPGFRPSRMACRSGCVSLKGLWVLTWRIKKQLSCWFQKCHGDADTLIERSWFCQFSYEGCGNRLSRVTSNSWIKVLSFSSLLLGLLDLSKVDLSFLFMSLNFLKCGHYSEVSLIQFFFTLLFWTCGFSISLASANVWQPY